MGPTVYALPAASPTGSSSSSDTSTSPPGSLINGVLPQSTMYPTFPPTSLQMVVAASNGYQSDVVGYQPVSSGTQHVLSSSFEGLSISTGSHQLPSPQYVPVTIGTRQVPRNAFIPISNNSHQIPLTGYIPISNGLQQAPAAGYLPLTTVVSQPNPHQTPSPNYLHHQHVSTSSYIPLNINTQQVPNAGYVPISTATSHQQLSSTGYIPMTAGHHQQGPVMTIPIYHPPSPPERSQFLQVAPAHPVSGTAALAGYYSTNPLMNSANMQIVWHSQFDQLFSMFYPQHWALLPSTDNQNETDYKTFNDSAKVRFLCQACGNAWTSMKGRVIFWFKYSQEENQGYVYFKLFGQQCQKCTPGKFEHAMWYPEEVVKVVTNIYHKIGQTYYGFQQPPIYVERRAGKPRTQHNSKLCQACADHICKEGWNTSNATMVATC